MRTIIKNEREYEEALGKFTALFGVKKSKDEKDEYDLLKLLIKDYENRVDPLPNPDPIEVLKLRMHELDMTRSKLTELTGIGKTDLSLIMTRKRELSFRQAKKLHIKLNIPARIFFYEAKKSIEAKA